jgi:plastocyanin
LDRGADSTFDLSNFNENAWLDMRPGGYMTFSVKQLADLGYTSADGPGVHFAAGNVYNALAPLIETNNGTAPDTRAEIDNIITGNGDDTVHGNDLFNNIALGNGNDHVFVGPGGAHITTGTGNDVIAGSSATNSILDYSWDSAGINVNLPDVGLVNKGDHKGIDGFTNINDFIGGTYDDTFVSAADGNDYRFEGNFGNNTLDYSEDPNFMTVDVPLLFAAKGFGSTGVVTGFDTFDNIQRFIGGTGGTRFYGTTNNTDLGANYRFDGAAGVANWLDYSQTTQTSIVVSVADHQVTKLFGTNSIATDVFSNVQNFVGAPGDDTFISAPGYYSFDGGQGNNNTLDYSWEQGVTIDLRTQQAAKTSLLFAGNHFVPISDGVDTFANIQTFWGATASTTFISNDDSSYNFNGQTGAINTLSYQGDAQNVTIDVHASTAYKLLPDGEGSQDYFTNIQNFDGGSGPTIFISAAGDNYTFTGGSGSNTLSYWSETNPVTIILNTGTPTAFKNGGADGTDTFSNIQSLVGGSGDDIFTFASGNYSFDGGGGNDTLNFRGAAPATVDLQAGSVTLQSGSGTEQVSNIETFRVFFGGGTRFISSNGPGPTGTNYTFYGAGSGNSLDYSWDTQSVSIDLGGTTTKALPGGGTATDIFSDIQSFIGGSGDDTFTGRSGNDTIDGGKGTNTLTWSEAIGPVTINLQTSTTLKSFADFPSIHLGSDTFTNIQDFVGTAENDTLIAGPGTHFFDGNGGLDTVVFHGSRSEYAITTSVDASGMLHTHVVDQGAAGDGTLDLVNVGELQFTDGTILPVTSLTTSPGSGDLNAGKVVTFAVTLGERVTVTGGSPSLSLNDDGTAFYTGGSGTSTLTFQYTVASGQNTSALAITAVNPNGATVQDSSGHSAALSGLVGSLPGTIQIDTIAPNAPLISLLDHVSVPQFGVLPLPQFGVLSGTAEAGSSISVSDSRGSNELFSTNATGSWNAYLFFGLFPVGEHDFTATATDGAGNVSPLSADFDVGVLSGPRSEYSIQVYTASDGLTHLKAVDQGPAGDGTQDFVNVQELLFSDGPLAVDTTIPVVSSVSAPTGDYGAGQTLTLTLDMNKAVTVSGTPTLTLNDGATANYVSGSGTNVLTFAYTVGAIGSGQNTSTLAVTAVNGSVTDALGQALSSAGLPETFAGVQVDTTAPTISYVVAPAGDYGPGKTITLTVDTSEAVRVSGTPTLALNDGGLATYVSGSGTNALTFNYAVGALGSGQNTSALAVTAVNGTVTDLAGNALSSSGLPETFAGVQVDTTAPGLIVGPHFTFAFTSHDNPNGIGATNFSAVNNAGVAVGDVSGGAVNGGFVYNAGTYTPVHDPSAPGVTSVSDNNNLGEIVGVYTDASGADHGFFNNGGNFTQLDFPSAVSTDSIGLNDAGQIAGYYTDSSNIIHGFLYSNGSYFSFDAPSAAGQTFAEGINNAGQIAGFYFDAAGTAHGFINTNGTFTAIDVPGATSTYTYDINNLGQVLGSYADSSGLFHAFLYQSGVFRTIDDPAATNGTDGFDISDVGMLAGDYGTANFAIHGYLASIVSSAAGLYGPGQTVTLTLDFSESVIVSGTPTLTLSNGAVANYASGSGTNALTFTYVVGPTGSGQSTSALAATAINGSITDLAGNGLSSIGLPDIFGGVVIDTSAPTVASVAASPASGDENTGNSITITLTMSEAVTVTGTPALILNDGGTANYHGGSGTSVLIFTYTVANAQNTPALAVTGNNLNGTTTAIKSATGNAADLTGADVTFSGLAIGATVKSVTASPASGDLGPGQTVTFTLTMSEAVRVSGTPRLVLDDGGVATYRSGSGTSVLTFSYTVGATGSGQNSSALSVTAFNPNGATIFDSGVRADTADLSGVVGFTSGLVVDTTAPTLSSVVASGNGISNGNGDLDAGNTVTLTITFSENVTVAGGIPTLMLNDGGTATYTGGSGTSALTFTYLVEAGQNTADLAVNGLQLHGASITDAAGNRAVLSGAAVNPPGTLQIDTTAPRITGVVASPANADLDAGKAVTLTVDFSEAVTVMGGGTPILNLNDGGTALYQSGSGTSALTFLYTVAAGQSTSDLTVTSLDPKGAVIADLAGNGAILSGAARNPAGTLKIDTTAPTVNRVQVLPGSGEVTTGQIVTIALDMSESMMVSGAPVLLLNDGGSASYDAARSNAATLAFDYTVKVGEVTSDLKVAGMAIPATASIDDLAGNAADLSHAGANLALRVNTTARGDSGPSGGNLGVGGSDTLELFGPSIASVTFAPGATATLKLDDAQQFGGKVAGFTAADQFDLADITFGSGTTLGYAPNAGNTGGTLTANDGSHHASIALLGQYMASSFAASSDGHGGTLITDPPPSQQSLVSHPHA